MLKKSTLAALLMLPSIAAAQPYFIAGVGTGTTDVEFIENAFVTGYTTDDDLQRAVVGLGFRASDYIAIEGLYLSRAEAKVSGGVMDPVSGIVVPVEVELEHQGLQLAVLASAPLTPQFSLYGKLTANILAIEMDTVMMGMTVLQDSDTASYLGAGAGARFQFNDQVGLRLGVERTLVREFADYTDGDFDIDQATLTLQFGF